MNFPVRLSVIFSGRPDFETQLTPETKNGARRRRSVTMSRLLAYAASEVSCTGPESWPLASTSRSTNSITAIAALSP
ncbi:hypothetical protein ACVIJ6_005233 [Bradyrhizobium sp. USDA 4369]